MTRSQAVRTGIHAICAATVLVWLFDDSASGPMLMALQWGMAIAWTIVVVAFYR